MALSLIISLLIVYVVYISDVVLNLGTIVALHIALIIFPVLFKASYVIRLTALKQLGKPAH